MAYVDPSRRYFGPCFLILCFQQCCSAGALSVNCTVINLEYVECIWRPNRYTVNYTFRSAFEHASYEDCSEYILERNNTVGCRIPLTSPKFQIFHTFKISVLTEGNRTILEKTLDYLKRKVQLNPPYNLSVTWNKHNSSLLLEWKSNVSMKDNCLIYVVRNLKDASQSPILTKASYIVPQVSLNKQYVFQVRSTLSTSCGESDLWSDWSDPVKWGVSEEDINAQGRLQGLYVILTVFGLFLLGCLLCYFEKKRIIFLPVVPDPSKNLQDLFHKHNGNVESWIHISKELKEAFQPDYTEPSCEVCEVTSTVGADPTPQTDNCDEPNTEEEPTEPQSS